MVAEGVGRLLVLEALALDREPRDQVLDLAAQDVEGVAAAEPAAAAGAAHRLVLVAGHRVGGELPPAGRALEDLGHGRRPQRPSSSTAWSSSSRSPRSTRSVTF